MWVLALAGVVLAGAEPNPPRFPASVQVFGPTDNMESIQSKINDAYATNGGQHNNGQFSKYRFAFLFKPGQYQVNVPIGFYTHVVGLGASPDDVVFNSQRGVYCEEGDYDPHVGALDTFWRAAENFRTTSNWNWQVGHGMMWAVSQGTSLRRVHVDNDLLLFEYVGPAPDAGYASGGYLANSKVGGKTVSGSQQQWMTRNAELANWQGGVWNMVFVGTHGAPASHCGNAGSPPITTVATTPLIAEKPWISVDAAGRFQINVPGVRASASGPDFTAASTVDFEQVFVATADDNATYINSKLNAGLDVVLSPGIYVLDQPLKLGKNNQILLGLGYPTLISANGNAVIMVGDVDGVKLVGPFLLQAGPRPTKALLQWGSGSNRGNAGNPGVMYDIFARVGGPDGHIPVQADTMIEVNSGHVIGDNLWLWRADHTDNGDVRSSANPCLTGLRVTGPSVRMYGLAVEHTLADLVHWTGNDGETYFYQSEYPYDVTQSNYGDRNFSAYTVADNVTSHNAWGVGVYIFMRDYEVTIRTGIRAPPQLERNFVAPLSVYLNGLGKILHVLNDKGAESSASNRPPKYIC